MSRDAVARQVAFWVALSIVLHITGGLLTKKAADRFVLPLGARVAEKPQTFTDVEFTPLTPRPVDTVATRTEPTPTDPPATPTPPPPKPRTVQPRPRPRVEPQPPKVEEPRPQPVATPEPVAVPQTFPTNLQHVRLPDSTNNEPTPENAEFLANTNHNVDEQTQAAIRDTHSVESNTSQVAANTSTSPGQGNSDREVSADDREQQGLWLPPTESQHPTTQPSNTTPAPASTQSSTSTQARTGSTTEQTATETNHLPERSQTQSSTATTSTATAATTPGAGAQATSTTAAVENSITSNSGTESINTGSSSPTTGGSGPNGTRAVNGAQAAAQVGIQGFGARRAIEAGTPTHTQFGQVFGAQADAERRELALRRSQARGSMTATNWQENRAAIENYTPTVRTGNQTALRTAQNPFSNYLTSMHTRIHRLFAESFIPGLGNLPADSPLADFGLVTTLEIVLEKDGRISRLGVVRSSGVTPFDVGALNSVRRSAPFGAAPDTILSGDGKVYLHWAFYRNERQCGTFNAEPFILPNPGGTLPVHTTPPGRPGHNPTDGPRRPAPAPAPSTPTTTETTSSQTASL